MRNAKLDLQYQIAISILQRMLADSMISPEEAAIMRRMAAEKYGA